MLHIVPAEVNTLLTQQSLAALLPTLRPAAPATTSGMASIGAVIETLTLPTCPNCGGKLIKSYDCMGVYFECENMGLLNGDCLYTLSARELEAVQ